MLNKLEWMGSGALWDITVTEHRIYLIYNAIPFKSPPYRAGLKTRQPERFEVQKNSKMELLNQVFRNGSHKCFCPGKNGKLSFCVDYRKLNSMKVRDIYPLPRKDECWFTWPSQSVYDPWCLFRLFANEYTQGISIQNRVCFSCRCISVPTDAFWVGKRPCKIATCSLHDSYEF